MTDFFVSYNSADRQWAEWIAWELEEAGFTTVLQAWDVRPGSNFVDEMDRATKETKRTIAVLSPDYLTSAFGAAEWQDAFRRDPTGMEGTLLPVRVRPVERSGLLGSIVYIDLVDLDEVAARDALLAGVEQSRAKPDARPLFPGSRAFAPADRSVPEPPAFPVAIFQVPHPRNPDFTGRERLLDRVRAALASAAGTTVLQAVYGLGGVGKTQVAIEYAYRHRAEYPIVWWLRAEDPSTLAADYAALGSALHLPALEATGQPEAVAAVRGWLERSDRHWLLVFDNVGEYDDLRTYLPRAGQGHVLATSRTREWPRTVQRLEVDVLAEREAVAFLGKRTGKRDAAGARALAETLGYLPLALDQAAAYIDARELTYAAYLARFQERREELLGRGKPPDYPDTVATTWGLSFAAAKEQAPATDALLTLLAFFAPEAIPLDLLIPHAEVLPESLSATMTDAIELDDAVAALRRYSLVEVVDEHTLSVHRLVQDVVRERLDDGEAVEWATAAVAAVAASFPGEPEEPGSSGGVRTAPDPRQDGRGARRARGGQAGRDQQPAGQHGALPADAGAARASASSTAACFVNR